MGISSCDNVGVAFFGAWLRLRTFLVRKVMMENTFVFTKEIDINGRIVIPAQLRKKYDLIEGDTVAIVPLSDGMLITKYSPDEATKD